MPTRQYEFVSFEKTPISLLFSNCTLTAMVSGNWTVRKDRRTGQVLNCLAKIFSFSCKNADNTRTKLVKQKHEACRRVLPPPVKWQHNFSAKFKFVNKKPKKWTQKQSTTWTWSFKAAQKRLFLLQTEYFKLTMQSVISYRKCQPILIARSLLVETYKLCTY